MATPPVIGARVTAVHSPTPADEKRFPTPAVAVLAFAGFISVTTELMPAGLLTQIAPDLKTGVAPAGLLTSAYALGIVLTVLPMTRLTLRVSRRTLLAAAVLAFVASNVVVALSPNLPVSLAGRFVGGASHGLLWSVLPPVISRLTGPARAGRAMAVVFAGNSLGLAAGAPLSTLLGSWLGWRWAFVVIAVAGTLIAGLILAVIPHLQATTGTHLPLRQAARLPGALRVSIAWALMLLGHFAVFTYIAPYLEQLDTGGRITTLALLVLGVAGILGVAAAGRTPSRWMLAGLVGAPTLIVAAFAALAVLPLSVPLVIALLIIWGAGFAAAVLYNQQATLIAGRAAPETVTSISVLVIELGIASGAGAGGLTVQLFGVSAVPLTGLVFVAASAALLLGMRPVLAAASTNGLPRRAHPRETTSASAGGSGSGIGPSTAPSTSERL